jgi:hypothetical protein
MLSMPAVTSASSTADRRPANRCGRRRGYATSGSGDPAGHRTGAAMRPLRKLLGRVLLEFVPHHLAQARSPSGWVGPGLTPRSAAGSRGPTPRPVRAVRDRALSRTDVLPARVRAPRGRTHHPSEIEARIALVARIGLRAGSCSAGSPRLRASLPRAGGICISCSLSLLVVVLVAFSWLIAALEDPVAVGNDRCDSSSALAHLTGLGEDLSRSPLVGPSSRRLLVT